MSAASRAGNVGAVDPAQGMSGLRRAVSDGLVYQACEAPQCGQATVVETDAANTNPQAHV
jgi:hypothetical protein